MMTSLCDIVMPLRTFIITCGNNITRCATFIYDVVLSLHGMVMPVFIISCGSVNMIYLLSDEVNSLSDTISALAVNINTYLKIYPH